MLTILLCLEHFNFLQQQNKCGQPGTLSGNCLVFVDMFDVFLQVVLLNVICVFKINFII